MKKKWTTEEEELLRKNLETSNISGTVIKYGVSDTSIRKWIKKYKD